MKIEMKPRLACWLVLATLCLNAVNSWARPPRAREMCGVVGKIDRETQTLTILPEKKDEPFNVVWKGDTRFIRNWKFADSMSLNEKVRACVYYRTPFFGKPFVTQVILN